MAPSRQSTLPALLRLGLALLVAAATAPVHVHVSARGQRPPAAFQPCDPLAPQRCEFVDAHDGFFATAQHRALAHISRMHGPVTHDRPHALLRVVTPTPIRHLDSVVLAYDIPDDAGNDWIGIYCVENELEPNADDDFLAAHPLQGSTRGEVEIRRLLNMRCSWHFRLFRGSTRDEHKHFRLAHTPYVRMARGADHPFQIHLALTGDPTQMRVMWVSGAAFSGAPTPPTLPQRVAFGERADALDRVVNASRSTYAASDMCEAPATTVHATLYRDPGQLWDAVLVGLEPGKQYFYRIETMTPSGAVSKVFQFHAAVAAGQPPTDGRPQSFFVYGDMGDDVMPPVGSLPSDRAGTTANLMLVDMAFERQQYNWLAVVHIGDISYAKGRTYIWDQFGAIIQPVAAELPYMVGVGNHDYCYFNGVEKDPSGPPGAFHPPDAPTDCQSGGECGVPLSRRYVMPATGNGVFWYSFDTGLVHHVVVSTEHDYTPGSRMYNWLVSDLGRVDRRRTPWVFLYVHRPMYCSEQYELDYKLSLFIRQSLETLCGIYGVDVVFSGHYHAYERTCPVFQEMCLSEPLPETWGPGREALEKALAPVHIMAGSAGAYVDDADYYPVTWSRRALKEYGYGRVHVHNATHVRYEFKGNHERAVVDSAWIISHHDWHHDIFERTAEAKRRTKAPTPAPGAAPPPSTPAPTPPPPEEDTLGLYIETADDLRHVMREKVEVPLYERTTAPPPPPTPLPVSDPVPVPVAVPAAMSAMPLPVETPLPPAALPEPFAVTKLSREDATVERESARADPLASAVEDLAPRPTPGTS
ncbi:hypothetical protein P43SY_009672 [Pythium insidiosum]|uniref:Purple acid phosphatase n=1 Tax=Pythium insidiosum TaxID=114742 RepID=A0AAD5L8J7_PYTIN|nr:hypothetical protein P43SY_009672 [Pythium insidiosum]